MAVTETERFSLAVLNFWKVKNMVVRMAMWEYVTYWKGYCDIFEKKLWKQFRHSAYNLLDIVWVEAEKRDSKGRHA